MKRLLAPLALLIVLLGASPAAAGLLPKRYGGQTALGVFTTSRSHSGSCSVRAGLPGDVVLRCRTSKGTARATYLFTLRKHPGSVSAQVNFVGSHRGAVVTTKRVSDTQFRVDVTLRSAGRAEITSVMIEYYCH